MLQLSAMLIHERHFKQDRPISPLSYAPLPGQVLIECSEA